MQWVQPAATNAGKWRYLWKKQISWAFNRVIKIYFYAKRQTSDLSWEFLRTENKQIKTVQNNSDV